VNTFICVVSFCAYLAAAYAADIEAEGDAADGQCRGRGMHEAGRQLRSAVDAAGRTAKGPMSARVGYCLCIMKPSSDKYTSQGKTKPPANTHIYHLEPTEKRNLQQHTFENPPSSAARSSSLGQAIGLAECALGLSAFHYCSFRQILNRKDMPWRPRRFGRNLDPRFPFSATVQITGTGLREVLVTPSDLNWGRDRASTMILTRIPRGTFTYYNIILKTKNSVILWNYTYIVCGSSISSL
jgi:hypothetical protein